MRVKSCEASDGINRPIQLSDEHGCVLRPKMVSKFLKLRSNDGRSTVMSYAFFHAFKFPDSLQVYIRCKVEICRHGCPEHCDKTISRPKDQYAYTSETKASYTQPETVPVAAVVPLPAPQPVPQPTYELPPQPISPAIPPQPQQYPQRRTAVPTTAPPQSKRPFFGIIGRKPSAPERSSRPGLFQKKKDTSGPVASAQIAPPPQVQAQVVDIPIPIPGSQTQDQVMVSVPSPIVQSSGDHDDPNAREYMVAEESVAEMDHMNQDPLAEENYAKRNGRFPHGPRSLNLDDE